MIKTELNYNPYLLETNIKFNGQAPRINSLVEKYQTEILQTWADKIPSLFYDEMNGYNFELEFSGTSTDFKDIQKAFQKANVTEEQVKLFHKNELDSRQKKLEHISTLFQWFEENPNRKFDFDAFREENEDLCHASHNCILLNGNKEELISFEGFYISTEVIEDIHELENTTLYNTPVIFHIDKGTVSAIKNNLKYLMQRKDVHEKQLFFLIQPPLQKKTLERTIKDLGIAEPQLASSCSDECILKYLEIYPVTEHICKTIRTLNQYENEIAEKLTAENQQRRISNREVYAKINHLEDIIKRLKAAAEQFSSKDNFEIPTAIETAEQQFIDAIMNWKNRRTKVTKESDAAMYAQQMQADIEKYYQDFLLKIATIRQDTLHSTEQKFHEWYALANFDTTYTPTALLSAHEEKTPLPILSVELMHLKEERYVMPKEDLLGKFFKNTDKNEIEAVLETNYYFQTWRGYAQNTIRPVIKTAAQNCVDLLKNHYYGLADAYLSHLEDLLKKQTSLKETVSAQLSEEEHRLQSNNDWLVAFQDQLRTIERG